MRKEYASWNHYEKGIEGIPVTHKLKHLITEPVIKTEPMKNYRFIVYLNGNGTTPEEGWEDATSNFDIEEEEIPMSYTEEILEDEE